MTRILDILGAPWAIMPDRWDQIYEIYMDHRRGAKKDLAEVEAAIGRPLNNVRKAYEVQNGVATIPIDGVIEKTMSAFNRVSGGVSTTWVQGQIQAALNDPAVDAIVLQIDSPGGTVDGTRELANFIYSNRGKKPMTAYADGLMASAAYWIGAAADKIILADETTQVGSIGVVATHVDQSGYNEKQGVKVTEVTAGKMKRVTSSHAPLSDAGMATLKETVDQLYNLFTADLAKFRNAPESTFRNTEARMYLGSKAIEAGLADGVSSLSDLVSSMSKNKPVPGFQHEAGAASANTNHTTKETSMNKLNLKTLGALTEEQESEITAFANKAREEGRSQAAAGVDLEKVKQDAAAAERERIQGVLDAGLPGHEALIQQLAFDGKTTPGEAALAVNRAERNAQKGVLAEIAADRKGVIAAPSASIDEPKPAPSAKEQPSTPEAMKKAWEASADLRAEFGNDFDAYVAYNEASAQGVVRILTK